MRNLLGKELLDRYHVDEYLGGNDYFQLYRVWDKKSMMPLLIKVYSQELSENELFVKSLQEEARVLCALQHPNILRVFGMEQSQSGVFLLMDDSDGVSLENILQNQKSSLPMEKIQSILRATGEALAYAGVHGALSPSSILIDSLGRIRICDFEISRLQTAAEITLVSNRNPYQAPESFSKGEGSPRSDVFSMGVLLYQMLNAGDLPFFSSVDISSEGLTRKVNTLFNNHPEMDLRLKEILLKCLALNPEERFSNVSELEKSFTDGSKNNQRPLAFGQLAETETITTKPEMKKETELEVPDWVVAGVLITGFVLIMLMFWNVNGIFQKDEVQPTRVSAVELTQTSLLATTVAELQAVREQQIVPVSGAAITENPIPTEYIEMKTATPETSPTVYSGTIALVLWPSVNVRTGPGTNFPVADYLFEGDEIFVLGRNGDSSWAMFIKDGQELWVAKTVFEMEGDLDLLPLIETPPPPKLAFTATAVPNAYEKPAPTATMVPPPTATDPPPPTPTENFSIYP